MTPEQAQVKQWMLDFGQECPDKPTIPSFEVRKLRVKLIYEEFIKELSQALGVGIYLKNSEGEWDRLQDVELDNAETELSFCDDWTEEGPESTQTQLIEIADGCEDLKVVTEGTLVACGLVDKSARQESNRDWGFDWVNNIHDPLFNEVMRSNFSKMWTRHELEKEFNTNIGLFSLHETKQFNNMFATFTKPHSDSSCFHNKVFTVKDQDGKVIKSPSYSPPNLQPIIDEMSK